MRRALLIALALMIAATGTAEAKKHHRHRHHRTKIIVQRMSEQEARAGVELAAHDTCVEDAACIAYGAVIANGALSCDFTSIFEWACFGWTRYPNWTCQFREYLRVGGIRIWDVTYGDGGWKCEREEE